MAKRPHTPARPAPAPIPAAVEPEPMVDTPAPVAAPVRPAAPVTPCLLTVPCAFPFQVTRSRPIKGGGYERYCDGCGAVQGRAVDSRDKAAG